MQNWRCPFSNKYIINDQSGIWLKVGSCVVTYKQATPASSYSKREGVVVEEEEADFRIW